MVVAVLRPDLAAVRFDDAAADREPEAGAADASLLRLGAPVEGLEDLLEVGRGNAVPAVVTPRSTCPSSARRLTSIGEPGSE